MQRVATRGGCDEGHRKKSTAMNFLVHYALNKPLSFYCKRCVHHTSREGSHIKTSQPCTSLNVAATAIASFKA
jgi:hypothetical protein